MQAVWHARDAWKPFIALAHKQVPLPQCDTDACVIAAIAAQTIRLRIACKIPFAQLASLIPCLPHAQVRSRQLWGNGIYTQDSDLVAVLMHCGYYNQAVCNGGAQLSEMRAHIVLLPPQQAYASCARNNIRSRAWGVTAEGCSYQVFSWPAGI